MSGAPRWKTPLLAAVGVAAVTLTLACGGLGGMDTAILTELETDRGDKATGPTRCDGAVARVDLWQGEYPMPIVNVTEVVEVPSYSDPCLQSADGTCRIEPGIYHPWGEGEGFVTLRAQERFTATRETALESEPTFEIPEGETVIVNTYLAEGYCVVTIDGVTREALCPGVEDDGLMAEPKSTFQEVQLMNPGCGSWVQVDAAFMAQPEITEGQIVEYGKVGE